MLVDVIVTRLRVIRDLLINDRAEEIVVENFQQIKQLIEDLNKIFSTRCLFEIFRNFMTLTILMFTLMWSQRNLLMQNWYNVVYTFIFNGFCFTKIALIAWKRIESFVQKMSSQWGWITFRV